jgi:hypothetical protein
MLNRLLVRLGLALRGHRSVRLTFAYDDAGIRLVRRTRRHRPPPPSDDPRRAALPRALTAELRTARGALIFRRVLHDPIPRSVEFLGPNGKFQRAPGGPRSGVFTVVVPFTRRADHLVLLAGPEVRLAQPALAPRAGEERRRRELARIPLR